MTEPTLPLVDAAWLAEHLDDPRLRVVDATVHLSFDENGAHIASAEETYRAEHIPGAVFIDQDAELSRDDTPIRFTPVDSDRFVEVLGEAGIGDDDTVVVYDHANGIWATRLWWHLGYEGFDRVKVLDGGLAAWKAAGQPTGSEEVQPTPATFTARRRPERIASTADVEAAIDDDGVLLVNALAPEDFARGHIPGSVNVPFPSLVRENGTLKDAGALREIFAAAGALDPTVRPVTYCGGGIAATAAAFALLAAGRDDVAIYDGSMTEWTADPSRPLEAS
ncbi:sulfurtransferase [Aeromicrobium piscarium]|uniref:thiosulfate sulfurtransferase n=1 Tax=Aeromicrobium piscarium TaxID=2590901 RepID=A0A554SBD6_9ACTN|nr:sulfurtransferase [Aeromicrobium piscarium]TSD63649.1 sulfurtransferase [Aeromicrobium piscarium]